MKLYLFWKLYTFPIVRSEKQVGIQIRLTPALPATYFSPSLAYAKTEVLRANTEVLRA
jgi:hypothetical protein